MKQRVSVCLIIAALVVALLGAPAMAKVVSVTVPEKSAANRPDPATTGNMLFGTAYAVPTAMSKANKDVQLTYIYIQVNGEDWLTVDPPRLYY
ncbi:MAG: hypothetical protein RDU89_05885 [bacterium]|nr:hypothetical protein [bacterium]